MPEPIEYVFSHAALPSAALQPRLMARWRRGGWTGRILAVVGGGLVGAAIAAASSMLDIPFWAGLALGLGPTVLYVALTQAIFRTTLKRIAREQANAPWREGDSTVRLDAEGIAIADANGRTFLPWSHVIDVIEAEGHLLLLLSPLEYVPVPQDAVTPLTLDDVADRVERWRSPAPVAYLDHLEAPEAPEA